MQYYKIKLYYKATILTFISYKLNYDVLWTLPSLIHNAIKLSFVSTLYGARRVNLKLNREKCKFLMDSLPYIGHILTKEGVRPDPNKV